MIPSPRKVLRWLAAGSAALVTAATLAGTPAAAMPSAAPAGTAAPAEVAVVPPDASDVSATDSILFAGATGFAHLQQGVDGIRWTDYATGASHPMAALHGVAADRIHFGGGDHVAVFHAGYFGVPIQIADPDSQTLTTYQSPPDFAPEGVGADGTTAIGGVRTEGEPRYELLDLATGKLSHIAGLPAQFWGVMDQNVQVDGEDHALLPYSTTEGQAQHSLVDLRTGQSTPVHGMPSSVSPVQEVALTATTLSWSLSTDSGPAFAVVPTGAVLAGEDPEPTIIPVPSDKQYSWVPVGTHLLRPDNDRPVFGPLLGIDATSPEPTTRLAIRSVGPVPAADGSVLAVGGADRTHTGVHRYTDPGDGTLADDTVVALPPLQPTGTAGISMARGNLRHIEAYPALGGGTEFRLFNHGLTADDDPTGSPYGGLVGGALPATTTRCQAGVPCVRTVDGNKWGVAFVGSGDGQSTVYGQVDDSDWPRDKTLDVPDATLVDASRNDVLVTSASTGQQYVVDLGLLSVVTSGPATGAALWDNRLWQATGAGVITESTLTRTDATVARTVQTGSGCQADELQVAQHFLYWSCGGDTAGVYDLTSNVSFRVPAGPALLGDGYLVLRGADSLQLVDIHTGAAAVAQRLAELPASNVTDDRNIDWTVDRYSGQVAYVSADGSVHVLTTGVPGSPVTAVGASGTTHVVQPRTPASGGWSESLQLDRPVDSWRVTFSRPGVGTVEYSVSGGATRQDVTASWDGLRADGTMPPSGRYRWQWYATVGGVEFPVQGGSGQLWVECGTTLFRTYDCLNDGAVMKVDKTTFHTVWRRGTDDGKLHKAGSDSDYTVWPLGTGGYSMIIPFGDLDGDGKNDLLVRNNSGEVGGYLGGKATYFERGVSKHVTIGSGYGGFTAIVSVGDLNDDGIDDLVVRNSSGVLYFKAGTGTSQFVAGVRFTSGWNKYVKLIGDGDLDGDGCGDLLAVDGDGVMWFYRGTKDGRFATKVRVESGWAKYNSIIGVGDITGDGIPDLIARDSAGTIWRYDGSGHATWSVKTQITTGWSKYAMF
ncbi:VCBS repeat-containing protein [Actinocatenispora sera]|uniref:FG-GAP repeat domain-containing protein n=1 Tax=Actinocatenispora sera TaxID=390989 RepID=UPI0033C30DF4